MRKVILALSAVIALAASGSADQASADDVAPPAAVGNAAPPAPAGNAISIQTSQGDAEGRVFEFRHVVIPSGRDAPSACLRFSLPLDGRPDTHYEDYVQVQPGPAPAVTVSGTDLCLGGLTVGPTYKVTLRQGLPSADSQRMDRDETVQLDLADRPASVAISGSGFILPRGESNGLAVQSVNVAKLHIHVLRIDPKRLQKLSPLPSRGGDDDDDDNKPSLPRTLGASTVTRGQIGQLLQNSARLVWSGTMDVAADHNRQVDTAFPLTDIVKPGQPGAYLVVAEPDDDTTTPESFFTLTGKPSTGDDDEDNEKLQPFRNLAAHWVMSTDLALTTMSGTDGLHVFARSLASAKPLAGVDLSLLANDGDELGHATTDADGAASFAAGLLRGRGAASARTLLGATGPDDDIAIIDLQSPAFDLSDRGVGGRPPARAMEAFLYTDRGIYRPGEIVQSMALLRDHVGAGIASTPVTLILRRPDGVEADRAQVPADAGGGFHHAWQLSKTAGFGMWSVEAYVDPSGRPVGQTKFDLEDFVPQQLKVSLKADKPFLKPGDELDVGIDGDFLYGAPAADLSATGDVRIVADPAPVKDAVGYQFGLATETVEDNTQDLDIDNSDAAGHTEIDATLPKAPRTSLPLKAVVSAGLHDPGGRFVGDKVELPIHTLPLLIGLKPLFDDDRAAMESDAGFELRVFNPDGGPIAATGLSWTLVRERSVFDWIDAQWHFHTVDDTVGTGTIDARADGSVRLAPHVSFGRYRLIVADPKTRVATSVRFWAGWSANGEAEETPDKVELSADKVTAAPGDTIQLHIKGPFAGEAQVSIANDRVFETHAVTVPAEGLDLPVTASADWGSGAYAMVTMVRPLAGGRAHDPVRAIGVAWLGIDTTPKTLKVAVQAPAKILPRQHIEVPVQVSGVAPGQTSFVTLAAVDEGILQLTRFTTPDPAKFLFGQRQLGIDLRDEYGRLLDGSAGAGPIHEGGDEGVGGPALPVTSTRIVSLWSGPVQVGPNGVATIPLDVPDFEGQLRLMAVAYSKDAVGSADAQMIVRDAVVANLYLPRFLAPGDLAKLALQVENTDGAAGSYHVALASDGPVSLDTPNGFDEQLDQNATKREELTARGGAEGIASIGMDVTGPNGYRLHRDWQIAVRNAHYPLTVTVAGAQPPGTAYSIDPTLLKPFLPGFTTSLNYSALMGVDVAGLLQELWRYPFGCTEQLASTAFPLLYFDDASLVAKRPADPDLHRRVQDAIDTILDRQAGGGEFGLWRVNDDQDSPWLNVYVIDFLYRAKDAGFAVPDGALERGMDWVRKSLATIDLSDRGVYAQGAAQTVAYAEYLMARTGRGEIGLLRRMADSLSWDQPKPADAQATGQPAAITNIRWVKDNTLNTLADPLALAQLAGALSLMGDNTRADRLFDLAIDNVGLKQVPVWWSDKFYFSEMRDLAGLIAVAAESNSDKALARIADRMSLAQPEADQLNTQEQAWLLMAAHALAKNNGTSTLMVNGASEPGIKLPITLAPAAADIAAGFKVENGGDHPVWRTLSVRGAPRDAPPKMANGLTIEKAFFGLDGKPVDPAHLRQNDRVIVQLSGHTIDRRSHQAVVVDPLPAGWEIEAAVTGDSGYDFLGELTDPKMREARDDRFVAAFDLEPPPLRPANGAPPKGPPPLLPHEYRLAYLVRVVTPGTYVLPEAVALDMYRPSVFARTDAGTTSADKPAEKPAK